MGCFDLYCFICGNPYRQIDNIPGIEYIMKYKKMTFWMSKCTILTSSGDIIHNCIESSCNFKFTDLTRKQEYEITPYILNTNMRSVFLHDDCWKYINRKYKIKLDYSMIKASTVQDFRKSNNMSKQIRINYNIIEKYWSQFFLFERVIQDKNDYMLTSPLKENPKNLSRINKIIKLLKLKTDRVGPNISASFEPENSIRIGNDQTFWIKKNNKWNKMPDKLVVKKIKLTHSNLNKFRYTPQICESSKTDIRSIYNNKKNKDQDKLFIALKNKDILIYSTKDILDDLL